MKINARSLGLAAVALLAVAGCGGKVGGSTGTGGSTGMAGGPGTAGAGPGMGGSVGTGTAGVTGRGGATASCSPFGASRRRVWRLAVEQWGAAVKDLLGLATAPVLS